MNRQLTSFRKLFRTSFRTGTLSKPLACVYLLAATALLSSCTINPATGESQFAGLMSPSQEQKVGDTEHANITKQYGGIYPDKRLQAYVAEVGKRVSGQGERSEVNYTFTLLDSAVVNAFAVPGGYIYVTRGLMATANSEAELAAVLAHETGHITARHSAERYSQAAAAQLGTTILGAVINTPGINNVLNTGAGLYLNSYSRGQETQADTLGMRYMAQAGYDPAAMTSFLQNLSYHEQVESKVSGKQGPPSILSTHPVTSDRVAQTIGQVDQYSGMSKDKIINRDRHLDLINGMTYGDSASQGFVRDGQFVHPDLALAFNVPRGFKLDNREKEVVMTSNDGITVIFDMISNKSNIDAASYAKSYLGKNRDVNIDRATVNGLNGATAAFNDTIKGQPAEVRLFAINFNDSIVRFQIAIPATAGKANIEQVKTTTYSFKGLRDSERKGMSPERIRIITARKGDTAQSIAKTFPNQQYAAERFLALNGMSSTAQPVAGRRYKVIAGY